MFFFVKPLNSDHHESFKHKNAPNPRDEPVLSIHSRQLSKEPTKNQQMLSFSCVTSSLLLNKGKK